MQPMATNTSLGPSDSSQRVKKREKTRPWKMSGVRLAEALYQNHSMLGDDGDLLFEKFNVTSASPAYCR